SPIAGAARMVHRGVCHLRFPFLCILRFAAEDVVSDVPESVVFIAGTTISGIAFDVVAIGGTGGVGVGPGAAMAWRKSFYGTPVWKSGRAAVGDAGFGS